MAEDHSSRKQKSSSDLVSQDEECLPADIITAIIYHLPADKLCRLKLLSKQWNQTLKSDDFILRAARHSKSVYCLIIVRCVKGFAGHERQVLCKLGPLPTPLDSFSPFYYDKKRILPRLDDAVIVGVAYGLICLSVKVDRYTEKFIVTNPLTGQSIGVGGNTIEPNQNGKRFNYFTYDDVAREFVTVCAIEKRFDETKILFNIYRSRKKKEWIKNICSPINRMLSPSRYMWYGNIQYFIGMKNGDRQIPEGFIVMFDIINLNFELHPVFSQSYNGAIQIVDCRGEPGILLIEEKDEFHLSYSLWHNRNNNKSIDTWSRIGEPISVDKKWIYIGCVDGCPVLTDFVAGFNHNIIFSRFCVIFLYPGDVMVERIVETTSSEFIFAKDIFTYYPTLISL